MPHNPEVLPEDDRIAGNHIAASFEHFTSGENPGNMFTKVGKKKTVIAGLPKKFETVRKALLAIPAADLKKSKPKKKPTTAKAAPKKAAKPKKDKPSVKPPRAVPRKPKPKKLISKSKGKKGRKSKK